jgi:hypothetical protein
MGRQQQHQTKTTNSQAATSPALQKSAVDSISEFQEIFGSRAASRQFRSQQPDAQSLASSLSAKLGMPTIQAKPSFRGLSSELTAKDSQIQSPRQNQTGLPDNLRAGIENLSGISMADVKVHFNSTKPSELQALAYTQGTDIYLGSGQEKHLAHEGWHVVQQKQGRVQPTMQAKGKPMNSDRALEKEADIMGAKALQTAPTETTIENSLSPLALPLQIPRFSTSNMPVQCLQDTLEDKKKLYEEIQKQCKAKKIVLSMPQDNEQGHINLYEVVKNKSKLNDPDWEKATAGEVASKYIAEVERNYPPIFKELMKGPYHKGLIDKPQVNQILGEALANLATVQDSNQANSKKSEEDQQYKKATEAKRELRLLTGPLAHATKGHVSSLLDIPGSRILYSSIEDLFKALQKIPARIENFNSPLREKPRTVKIVQIKNRFKRPGQQSGYADIRMNLKMSNGHILELRLELKQFGIIKKLSEDEFVQEVEKVRGRTLRGEGTVYDLYELINAMENNAKGTKQELTNEDKALIAILRRKTYELSEQNESL